MNRPSIKPRSNRMAPKVVNIKSIKGSWPENTVRVDRRSRWGNPFVMRNGSVEERNRVCDAFEEMAANSGSLDLDENFYGDQDFDLEEFDQEGFDMGGGEHSARSVVMNHEVVDADNALV